MSVLKVTTRDGVAHEIAGEAGMSVMEIIREAGIDELMAICGGCMSCATCHVYVDSQSLTILPPASEDESELLEGADDRRLNSRLSCQIEFTDTLDGLQVIIAPE
jgi:2Fe-2S ferredoxin